MVKKKGHKINKKDPVRNVSFLIYKNHVPSMSVDDVVN